MCGRYTLTASADQILARFELESAETPITPRYNIAPSQLAPVVTNAARRVLSLAQWGIVPPWQNHSGSANRLINARVETLVQKPTFRRLLTQRCLVLANGFYEWQRLPDGTKQPMYITLSSGEPFAMAGLWDAYSEPDGHIRHTFVIITTVANALVAQIHERMPAILSGSLESDWLGGARLDLDALRQPFLADHMVAYPVSLRLNSVKFDDPTLIQPVR